MSDAAKFDNSLVFSSLLDEIKHLLVPYGFEIAPFLTGWYNELVDSKLKFDCSLSPYDDCLAICIISTPHMFEKTFLPVAHGWLQDSRLTLRETLEKLKHKFIDLSLLPTSDDPLDWAILLKLRDTLKTSIINIQSKLNGLVRDQLLRADWIPDFSVKPVTRIPYVHVQTAGHVSGIAYFHQPNKYLKSRSLNGTGLSYVGCSLHKQYGGWFAFRGVYVFPNLRCPYLPKLEPISPIPPGNAPFPSKQLESLFYEYNEHWRDNKWRDIGFCTESLYERYSPIAQSYFNASNKRQEVIKSWFNQNPLN